MKVKTKKKDMKLTVQDLAMFLGCKCEITNRQNIPESIAHNFSKKGDRVIIDPILLMSVFQGYFEAKPILRPLSDMTQEEEKYTRDSLISALSQSEHQRQVAENFKYLIQRQIDVFGWIEKGLAISKV